MIRNLVGRTTEDIFDGINSRHARKVPRELHDKARRVLDQLNAAPSLEFLRIPPSNRLEKLKGDLAGYWSLRINDQWRLIVELQGEASKKTVHVVEIVDYH